GRDWPGDDVSHKVVECSDDHGVQDRRPQAGQVGQVAGEHPDDEVSGLTRSVPHEEPQCLARDEAEADGEHYQSYQPCQVGEQRLTPVALTPRLASGGSVEYWHAY